MNKTLILLGLVCAQVAWAGGEVKVNADGTRVGKGFGTLSGFMVGAAGGPVGIVIGAMTGSYTGEEVQKGTGTETETGYLVRVGEDEVWVPAEETDSFEPGDVVEIVGDHLQSVSDSVAETVKSAVGAGADPDAVEAAPAKP